MKNSLNPFTALLFLLKVKHTHDFSNQYFNEHPHKYNLYGLSKMLSYYGIENGAIRVEDKENDITEVETPFIAQFGGDFVAVNKVEQDKVSFLWKGINHNLISTNFIEAWTGIILLVEASEKSGEPEYKKHRKTELLNRLKKITLFTACGLVFAITYIYQSFYTNPGLSLLILINLAGLFISWLLLTKQMHIQSQYADKICSLFKQKDCNNVLESKAAKLWGIAGWSEIGFGYFLTNVLLLLFSPALITTIAWINILTLPFTLWSVWYQRIKAKQWCLLCLIVLISLWTIFIINFLFGYFQITTFIHQKNNFLLSFFNFQLFFIGCCYFISILVINLFVLKLNTDKTMQSLQQSINSIKADDDVFMTLLKKQPFFETSESDSIIRFGNPKSKLQLTVLTNPYCIPCSKMHMRIEELLRETNNNISIQYILSSFEEKLNSTNKHLIASCLGKDANAVMQVFHDWFEKGVALQDNYFKNPLNIEKPEIEAEFLKHEEWKQNNQMRATPTVLVNGYQLPESYKVEDLQYFTTLDL